VELLHYLMFDILVGTEDIDQVLHRLLERVTPVLSSKILIPGIHHEEDFSAHILLHRLEDEIHEWRYRPASLSISPVRSSSCANTVNSADGSTL
jgi:hypothetical protein